MRILDFVSKRRATSCQPRLLREGVRWSSARARSLNLRGADPKLTVTAACINRPAAMISSSRETTPVRARGEIDIESHERLRHRRSSMVRTSFAEAPKSSITAGLARRMLPSASSDKTPVGIFSSTVSISWRRRSNSWTACCRLRVNWSICERESRSCVVMVLKERTRTPSSSWVCSGTWYSKLPEETSRVPSASAWMGKVTCLAR